MNKKISVRMLTVSAMLIALEIVLNRFCSINTAGWKIGFSFVPVVMAAILYGPATAAVVNAGADFLGAMLFPIGPYHPGFTVCAACMGFIYGLFLYQKPGRMIRFFPHIVVPAVVNNVVFGLLINTAWVSMLFTSKAYGGWFMYRLPEYAILIPLNLLIIPILLPLAARLKKFHVQKKEVTL